MKKHASVTAVDHAGVCGDARRHGRAGRASPQADRRRSRALRRFSGTPIDVDYQAANLRTVLRNLAEIGGINLVIDPSVPTERQRRPELTQVPWDQVMDVVLQERASSPTSSKGRCCAC